MVFSFFKKQPQKMPERPAARPRAPEPLPESRSNPPAEEVAQLAEPLPDLEFTSGKLPPPAAPPRRTEPPPAAPLQAPAADLDFTVDDFSDFTESSVMAIDVEHGGDPLQADIEQAVVLFANGQDSAARSLLEMLIRSYPGSEGQRFWLLLFDLLQVSGDRDAFEKLGVEFAEACETSPPAWRQQEPAAASLPAGPRVFVLQGVLTAEGAQPVADLAALVARKVAVSVDCGKLVGCDDEVAGQLAELLNTARRTGVPVALDRVDGLLGRLNERLIVGDATHAPAWLLLLELLQRYGTQEAFEERAVDYAVTFERSPPSWETPPRGALQPPVPAAAQDAYCLAGDLKSCRFEELQSFLEANDPAVLDFSAVRRMDFFSAGQLVNRLAPFKLQGREIVIRSPSHLVAELMAVVGLNKQARIVIPKS